MSKKKTKKDKRANSGQQEKKNRAKAAKKVTKQKEARYDAFGRRFGTQGALIDEKINKAPKSIEQLAKETKLPSGRIVTHVRDLTGKGFLVKNKKGFALNPNNKAAQALLQERGKK